MDPNDPDDAPPDEPQATGDPPAPPDDSAAPPDETQAPPDEPSAVPDDDESLVERARGTGVGLEDETIVGDHEPRMVSDPDPDAYPGAVT